MKPPSQTETDLPPPPFGGAQGAAHRFAQDLHQARYRTSDPEQLLGEGGIGRVIIAEETLLRRPVAMKTLREDRAGELYEARLIREARITGLLEHPSIVPVHDIGRNDDGKIYYTMKKVVGLTLREVIEHLRPSKGDTTDEAKALRKSVQERFGSIPARLGLFQKVCDAIAFAHAHPLRVIHRDLKPENIMVGEFGEVLVMDWGLAKVLATDEETLSEALPLESSDQTSPAGFTVSRIALSTAGQFVGTPMYAAPEQLEGRLEDIDEKSDVYALGGVLYHLLTLEAPISGEPQHTAEDKSPDIVTQTAKASGSASDWDTLVKFIRSGHVAPLLHKSTGSNSIPEALRPLLQRALGPDRSQRIASVSALQQAISQFLTGYANAFEQAGAWKHFVYFVKRHKGVALASAAALIIIASLTAEFTRRVTHEKERATKAEAETAKQLVETNRQLERSHLEEGKTWLERGRAALNKGEHLSAIMLAGRAIGYNGFGRRTDEPPDFSKGIPLLLGAPMSDEQIEQERRGEASQVIQFIHSVPLPPIPLWEGSAPEPLTCIAFSPDSSLLASGSEDNSINLWDLGTGKKLASLQGHSKTVGCIAFSPDCTLLASASWDSTIKIWEVATGNVLASLHGETSDAFCVTFSPDGTLLASASIDNKIKLWDITTHKELTTFQGHKAQLTSIAFSPDGAILASGSFDTEIKLWNVDSRMEQSTFHGHTQGVLSVAFSPLGELLASGSNDSTIKIWEVATGKVLASLHGGGHHGETSAVNCVTFSPDGTRIASGSTAIKLWDSATRKELATFGNSKMLGRITFSPDGTHLGSVSFDQTAKIWDIAMGAEINSIKGHKSHVKCVAYSPEGTIIASGAEASEGYQLVEETIELWDSATGVELGSLIGHKRSVYTLAFSPDGSRIASGSNDRTIKLWNAFTGKQLASLQVGADYGSSIVFSPDGSRIASGSTDNTIELWEVATGKPHSSFKGHTDVVASVAFSPDGSHLASGSVDGTIILWDSATGRQRKSLKGHSDAVESVTFGLDGLRLASRSVDGTIMLWDTTTGMEFAVVSVDDLATAKRWLAASEQRISPDALRIAEFDAKDVLVFRNPMGLDLTAPLRAGLLALPGFKLQFPQIKHSTSMLHVRQDTMAQLADPKLTPERRAELRMELCTKSRQFRAATAQWKSLPEQAPNSPIRRLYLLALIDATKHPQIHGHPTICQTAAQITPVLTKEMMALPTISLAMMSLMQSLTEDESAEMKAPRDSLLKKLNEVASPEWLAALQASTMKP